jgi:hypothetical protein
MVVNFRTREISQGVRKLTRIPTLIKEKSITKIKTNKNTKIHDIFEYKNEDNIM